MPSYNSEKTIGIALQSIRNQDICQGYIEILVIDGGSTDKTIEIAQNFGAKIIRNERRLPEIAKSIGLQQAQGKYIIENDSDEVYIKNNQLRQRIEFMTLHPEAKCILADRHVAPNHYAFSCSYLNTVGDPFTAFVYKSKGSVIRNLKKHIYYQQMGQFIFKFNQNSILPIGDGGTTMIDMDYVREEFPFLIHEQCFASTIFDEVSRKTGFVACIQDDNILHYSATSLKIYLKKLKFRIINNIFDIEGSGYAARALKNVKLARRKYLFPLYCISIIWPIIDAIKLSVRFRDLSLLMHPIYAYYVLFEIFVQYTKKALGKFTANKSYGAR